MLLAFQLEKFLVLLICIRIFGDYIKRFFVSSASMWMEDVHVTNNVYV